MKEKIFERLPDGKGALVVLSGGLDSTIATILASERYGWERTYAVSFDYGQKQVAELTQAAELTSRMSLRHFVIDLSDGDFSDAISSVSANISGTTIVMPTIKDVLGDPQPVTYVPNRNMIMVSIAASIAEAIGVDYVITGLQARDAYGYWDTTQTFIDAMNAVLKLNRKNRIKVLAPFADMSKADEIMLAVELDATHLLKYTLSCYNPDTEGRSCGKCPTCAERLKAFVDVGVIDPISYSIDIPWQRLIGNT